VSAAAAVGDAAAERLRVCVVAHAAYGAMIHDPRRHVGGVERQTTLLSRWLAARGHDVSLVTWDEGQADGARVDGVRLLKLCRRDDGLPGLRFLHPRWTSLWAALDRAGADLYYQNCAEYVTGQVALWSERRGRPFVYWTASDTDCDPRLPALRTRRERILYRYGLRRAERLIVQTRAQQRRLREGFGLEATVIPAPCPGPSERDYAVRAHPGAAPVLWVGRVSPEKRPDRLLDLAQACPELSFDLVGPFGDGAHARAALARARGLSNVTVHGALGREPLGRMYARALCLVSTSDYEGFPNTFLEAWSHGLPVVSTVDPDGLIAARGLGAPAASGADLALAVRRFSADRAGWARASAHARAYYLENHTVDMALARVEQAFLEAVASRRRRRVPPA
jgi:glycosyltransferase involved in cell wall biosynthesis